MRDAPPTLACCLVSLLIRTALEMALRAAAPQWRRCLQAAAAQQRHQLSGSALAGRVGPCKRSGHRVGAGALTKAPQSQPRRLVPPLPPPPSRMRGPRALNRTAATLLACRRPPRGRLRTCRTRPRRARPTATSRRGGRWAAALLALAACLDDGIAHLPNNKGGAWCASAGGARSASACRPGADPHPRTSAPAPAPAPSPPPTSTQVPGPEAEGVEREVKWGQNIPASAEQAKEELKYVRGPLGAGRWVLGAARPGRFMCGLAVPGRGRLAACCAPVCTCTGRLAPPCARPLGCPCRRPARGWPSRLSRAWACC